MAHAAESTALPGLPELLARVPDAAESPEAWALLAADAAAYWQRTWITQQGGLSPEAAVEVAG